MSLTLQIDRESKTAIYQQIAEQIKARIGDGRLPAATRLPPVRRLAVDVGVTRLTVQNAYAELQSDGWVEATVGRGTFVRPQQYAGLNDDGLRAGSPESAIRYMIQLENTVGVRSLAVATPDPHLFPVDEFWAAISAQRNDLLSLTTYPPSQGHPTLRIALCDYLRTRGIDAHPDELLVTGGASQGLALTARALARPGDTVLVEQPSYVSFIHALKALDSDGLVIYTSSFSKTFMPGLRIGYVMAQPPLAARLLSLRRADDLCGVAPLQCALAHFCVMAA